jgi:HlyD family secretion protein
MAIARKWWWTGAVVVIVASLAVWLLRPKALDVEVVAATRGPLAEVVEEDGETRVLRHVEVTAPVAGRVVPVELDAGDSVAPGRVVARLYPLPLDARLREQAEARLRSAQATRREAEARVMQARVALDESRKNLGRVERLVAAGSLPVRDLDAARAEERSLGGALDAARYHASAASYDARSAAAALMGASPDGGREPLALRAPVHGRVLRIFEEHERAVDAGTPIVEIGDPASLEVVVDLLSEDAQRVPPGAPMLLRAAGGEDSIRAKVRVVEPVAFAKTSPLGVEERRVNVIGDFIDPPGSLGHGFRVRATIVLWRGDDVLQLPASAIFRRGDAWAVFVVAGDRARLRAVRVGRQGTRTAQILEGVAPGERVVRHPGADLEDGARVRVTEGGGQ